jgi:hypothetical protein
VAAITGMAQRGATGPPNGCSPSGGRSMSLHCLAWLHRALADLTVPDEPVNWGTIESSDEISISASTFKMRWREELASDGI